MGRGSTNPKKNIQHLYIFWRSPPPEKKKIEELKKKNRWAIVREAYLQGVNCRGAFISGAYCRGTFVPVAFVRGFFAGGFRPRFFI